MKYRPEIDGLRTVAVLPVIFFHAGFSGFSGGFVGVDVFFVISGYLITGILLSDLQEGRFSLLQFYERRARRILPALFLVMAVCLPLAYVLMLPGQFREFGQSVVSVIFFVSNVLFWLQDDYFGAAAELKPLLHTWSLAVEEQYYIFFPLALWVFWRTVRSKLALAFGILWVVSFVLCEWAWRIYPSANFFLLPTRMWELLSGSICAIVSTYRPQRSNGVLSILGLALILFAIATYSDSTPFPSSYTLVPVLGAVLLILFASNTTLVGRLLGTKPFVAIGLVSYSAYLWHQPLFAFARISSVETPSTALMFGLSLLTLFLAWLTWKFVEQPFRRKERMVFPARRSLFLASVSASLIFASSGVALNNTNYFEASLNEYQRHLLTYVNYKDGNEFRLSTRLPDCFYRAAEGSFEEFNADLCLKKSKDKPNVLLVGDSHAAHLWRALQEAYPNINLMQATASGCRPLLPLEGQKRCTDLVGMVYGQIMKNGEIDAVILSARWQAGDTDRLAETIRVLRNQVSRVYVLGPTIEYSQALPMLLMRMPETDVQSQSVWPYVEAEVFKRAIMVRDASVRAGAQYIDVAGTICHAGLCRVRTDDGVPMSWDYGHFTLPGARQVVRQIDTLDGFSQDRIGAMGTGER